MNFETTLRGTDQELALPGPWTTAYSFSTEYPKSTDIATVTIVSNNFTKMQIDL
jgi:hypothetical protein